MGYKIGVPSMKLNNSGKKSKHCGSFGGVTREALEEREGRDPDINHELSHLNVYTGYRSAAELMEYSDRHVQELKDASGRAIRADAVRMCATIFKPPAVYMNKLSYDKQQNLLDDCLEFFEGLVSKQNIKSTVTHFDEQGSHMHVFWEPMTADGRLCAKEIHNVKLFSQINENLPTFLRERGWDIEDCDCYDKSKRDLDEEKEREKHYQKRLKNGRSSATYKLEAEMQKNDLIRQNNVLEAELELKKIILADIEDSCPIKTFDDLKAVQEETAAEIDELYDVLNETDKLVFDLQQEIEVPGQPRLRQLVEDLVHVWNQNRDKLVALIESIKTKIKDIDLFEKIRNIPEHLRSAKKLEKTVAEVTSRAAKQNNDAQELVTATEKGLNELPERNL